MAIDTAVKRLSVIQLKMPFRMTLPFPSGTVTSPDRYTLAGVYAGTNFTPPPSGPLVYNRVHKWKNSQYINKITPL